PSAMSTSRRPVRWSTRSFSASTWTWTRPRSPGRSADSGPVRAADPGVHRAVQVRADRGVGLADPGQLAPDRLSDGDPRAFRTVGEVTGPAAEAGGAGQFVHQPLPFGAHARGVRGVGRLDLGVQPGQAVPVLA